MIDDPLARAPHAPPNDRLQGETLEEVGDDRMRAELMNPVDRARRRGAGASSARLERHPPLTPAEP